MANSLVKFILNHQFIAGILFIIVLIFLYLIRDILVLIFIACILSSALLPFSAYLQKKNFPKTLSVVIPFFAAIILIVALIIPLVPFFIYQVQVLIDRFPDFLNRAFITFGVDTGEFDFKSIVTSEFKTIGSNIITLSSKIFGGLFAFLTVLILTFYFMLDQNRIRSFLVSIFPQNKQNQIKLLFEHVGEKLGAWLRGQIILSFFIGLVTWFALSLLRFEFALPLAVLAGILEVVPTMGPILAAIPAVIIALNISPTMAIIITIIYIIIQALENNILVPFIMQKAVGLHPIFIILGIIIGSRLMGIEGALLSIPFISMLVILKNNLQQKTPR